MKKIHGEYEGMTGKMNLYYHSDIPEKASAIVLVIHGMMEHSGRYDHIKGRLLELNMGYAAIDLPGHGRNVGEGERPGNWLESGFDILIDEIGSLINEIKDAYGIPVILFGHSMGSFIALGTICRYGDSLKACILSGTNDSQSPLLVKTGLVISSAIIRFMGPDHRSPLLYNLIFGSYNKRIKHVRTKFDWLSGRNDIVDEYVRDPLCGFISSTLLYKDMAGWLMHLYDEEKLKEIPGSLPVYIFSGGSDPVGDYGKGPAGLRERLVRHGLTDVRLKIYEGNRHECLNEANSDEVIGNVLDFCTETLGGTS